jgi:hypothetical protein
MPTNESTIAIPKTIRTASYCFTGLRLWF